MSMKIKYTIICLQNYWYNAFFYLIQRKKKLVKNLMPNSDLFDDENIYSHYLLCKFVGTRLCYQMITYFVIKLVNTMRGICNFKPPEPSIYFTSKI
ncbi:hypothetical protein BpHYR1_046597 [Brachionus plicatilis]|uniref:Uncharacterized protein n=1 Tax=Brachionus plicatilis TaxID=10195 RepID=A0A3M7S308_BRAPC|nr:hypothetical protein BpHYR1_046597 [Brachionus plicatilis]